nr:hypothetical transcript [Hymenolepis microstoma]
MCTSGVVADAYAGGGVIGKVNNVKHLNTITLRTESTSAISALLTSHSWGGPGCMKSSRYPSGFSWWKKRRRLEMI